MTITEHVTGQAVGFRSFGGPEVLEIMTVPVPEPEAGEVVVEVAFATVNPTDLEMRLGGQAAWMDGLEPPFTSGMEFSGTIHAVGPDVTEFAVGDAIMGAVNPRRSAGGAHSQFVRAPVSSICKDVTGLALPHVATLPMNGLTAVWTMRALDLPPGGVVLVTGAPGVVGGYVVQLAKLAGFQVVADAAESDIPLLKELGVDHIVSRGESMTSEVLQLYPLGVDGALDAARLCDATAAAVKDGGTMVSLRSADPLKDSRVSRKFINVVEALTDTAALERVCELAASGTITTRVAHAMPFTEVATASRLVDRGGLRGRVVLDFRGPRAD